MTAKARGCVRAQAWVLGPDKTVRVAAHMEFCLDIDGGLKTPGTRLITFACNNISISKASA